MSSMSSGIAASASQSALQQSQAARASDAVRNRDEAQADRLRKLLEKHVNEVEDAEQADPKQLPVNEHHPDDEQGRKRREQRDEVELTSADPDAAPESRREQPAEPTREPLYRHLDIRA